MHWVAYVDDVYFYKIEPFKRTIFVFAGNGLRIQGWKNWLRSQPQDLRAMPPVDGICVWIIDMNGGMVIFEKGGGVSDHAYFAGTGAKYAQECWSRNQSAIQAVETAKKFDIFTGGEVKYFELEFKRHNLYPVTVDVTIDMVQKTIFERGCIVDLNQPNIGSVPAAASPVVSSKQDLESFKQLLASGTMVPESPSPGMNAPWTEHELSSLKSVLTDVMHKD
jgi:hypothetical protein